MNNFLLQLIGDCKMTPRKSWVVTSSTSDGSSSSGANILSRLSSDRLKRDSTPEFNSSYHYKDENVEFDSPEPPNVVSNDDCFVDKQNADLNSDLLVDNSSVSISGVNSSQFSKIRKTDLLNSEPNPGTSRRDTYFVEDEPIVMEQNKTPAPRRSILKCSKTTKPNRSRSSCRMVQFARLPKSDSRINKISKSRFNSGSNFFVTSDENESDHQQDSKQAMNFNVEEYDDDLDGVQPLDNSVASLIVSPILDNSSVNKSIKRGSRGNKVMSLINSFEKRTNESPKHSIRASDLLSMSGLKYVDTLSENDSINNSNLLQESISSSRRINLENIFESEDSLKNISCDHENESMSQDINNSVQNIEMISNETNLLNDTETENNSCKNLPENVSYCEYNFALPLNIHPQTNSGIITETSVSEDQPIFVEPENIEIITSSSFETGTNQLNVSHNLNNYFKTTTITSSNTFDNADNETENTDTQGCEKICTNEIERSNVIELTENSIKAKDVSEYTNESICVENNQSEVQSNVSKLEKSTSEENDNGILEIIVDKDQSDVLKNVSKSANEQSSNEESPSKVVECMSKMINISVDELETSFSQQTETVAESFVFIEKDDLQKSFEKNKTSETVVNTNAASTKNFNESLDNDCNELDTVLTGQFSSKNNDKTLISETENSILQTNYIHSKNSLNTLSTIKSVELVNKDIDSSASKTTLSVKDNVDVNDSISVENPIVFELSTRTIEIEPSIVQKSNSNSTTIAIDRSICNLSIDSLEEVPSGNVKNNSQNENLTNISNLNHSKQLNKSVQSMVNASTVDNDVRNTCSSKKNKKLNVSHIDRMEGNENIQKSPNNLEHTSSTTTIDTSIGKPRFESTPWTSAKSSKTPKHATNEISNEPPHNDSDNMDKQRRSRSITPFPEPELWAQMMKDFNASVKKASISQNKSVNLSSCSKILFNQESNPCQVAIKITTEEELISDYTNVTNNTSHIQKENTIRHSLRSSYSPSNTQKSINEYDLGERSYRNKNKSMTKTSNVSKSKNTNNTADVLKRKSSASPSSSKTLSTKSKKTNLETSTDTALEHSTSKTEHDNNSDSSLSKSLLMSNKTKKMTRKEKTCSSPTLPPPRRNLRGRVIKNESIKKHTKVNKIVSVELTTSSDTEMSPSTSRSTQSSRRKLRRNEHNLNNEELKPPVQDNNECTSVSFKTNTSKLEENNKSNKSTLPTKTYITRRNTSLIESSLPMLDKKNKTSSPVKTKSTNVGKTIKTKKLQPKQLSSKPIKTSLNDSSEYETISEGEDDSQNSQLVEVNKENMKKKVSSNVVLQVSKRGRKRAAETPIFQPNAKGPKHDISSKVASTTISHHSNSPQKLLSSEIKLAEIQIPNDSSLVSTRVTRKEKQKTVEKIHSKKRVIISEDSSDSAPSARKITRNNIKAINCEIKSEDSDSAPSVRRATRNRVQAKNSSDSAPPVRKTRNNSQAKKAEINSEDSSDSAPSLRKVTRNNVHNKNSSDSVPLAKKTTRSKAQAKKSEINTEDSSDSAPSNHKMTRKAAKDKENEINKSTTPKSRVRNTNTKESKTRTQVKMNM